MTACAFRAAGGSSKESLGVARLFVRTVHAAAHEESSRGLRPPNPRGFYRINHGEYAFFQFTPQL